MTMIPGPGKPKKTVAPTARLHGWKPLLVCWPLLAGAGPVPLDDRLPDPGSTLERELAGGGVHRYRVERRAGEDLWLVVVQDGIDVTVSVAGKQDELLFTVDSPGSRWGEEWLYLGSEESAAVAVEIRTITEHTAPGRYRLSAETRGPLGENAAKVDLRRRVAERAATEAGRLHHAATRESRRLAVEAYRRALAAWQALGSEAEATRTLFLLGMLHRRLDEPDEALTLLRRALAGWRSQGERQGEAQALMEIASTARILGGSGHVEETYQQALDVWRALGDLHGQARALNHLGLIRARGAPRGALEPYDQALAIFRQLGDVLQEGVVLNNLGGVHDLLGEPHRALEHFRQALEIHQRLGNVRQEASVWNNIASIHRRTGRLEEALDGYRVSLEARRELDDRRGQGRVLNNMGLTWLSLGDPPRARVALDEALALRRESRDRRGEAFTLQNLGWVHAELDAWDVALDHWSEALALRHMLGDRSGEATTLVAMGRAASRLNRKGEARRHLQDALALLDQIGNPWRQANAWAAMGNVLAGDGEPAKAVRELERSLRVFRDTGDQVSEGEALLALAHAERATVEARNGCRLASAFDHSLAALDLLDGVRAGVDSLGLRTSFLSRHGDAFTFAIDVAMELHRRDPAGGWAAKALEIGERARARGLLDLLKESGTGLRRGVDADLLARQQELLERLNARVERRRRQLDRKGPSVETERLALEIDDVRAGLEAVEKEMRRQSPAWDALVHPRPLGAAAIQALLDPETTLLEYSLGEERSFLWAVTTASVDGFELPGREVIETAVREVYENFRMHDPRAQRTEAERANRLSEILLGPLAERLTDQRLVIVADGALHYLPFAALPHPAEPAEPLLARHEVVSLPSASALAVQRQTLAGRPVAAKALAVLADPVFDAADPRLAASSAASSASSAPVTLATRDPAYRDAPSGGFRLQRLAWSGWEAETIAGHAGDGQALLALGFNADLEAVRGGRLEGYRIVHFATHGIVESEHPELSALVLSLYDPAGRPREGFLRLPEIYNLDLDAELVVLSGCRTALGPEIRGEGLVGLTRGFFAAGARRLVASLWRVQDRSAAELMDRFYRRLMEGDRLVRPAAALRAAQLELMSEPEFRAPYHWAAFAVYGDWR